MESLLAAATPPFDGAYFVALASRVAHTLCAATLLGGLVYMRLVLAPAAPAEGREAALYAGRRGAWAAAVGVSTGLLLLSGIYNLVVFMGVYKNLPKLYHPLFGVKFLLALGVMAIMALVAGRTTLAERVRGNLRGWLDLALALCVATFVLGAMLRSFRDLPDARTAPVAAAAVVPAAPVPAAPILPDE